MNFFLRKGAKPAKNLCALFHFASLREIKTGIIYVLYDKPKSQSMIRKACLTVLILSAITFFSACTQKESPKETSNPSNEVIYHVFLRSFYDSDGDGHGDLKGLQEKLDYLQDIGVTAILVPPINASEFYHNYFSGDFETIDPEFGNDAALSDLLKEMHRRGMKFYLDMETQYITEDHPWWKDSYGNPSSKYSDYLIYNGKGNTEPETIIFDLKVMPGYNGVNRKVTTVNLLNKDVLEYNYNLFKRWMDLNGDGKFDDGVDGFRLDHAMDDLDWKGKLTGLHEKFWKPLISRLKQINPQLMIIAEQAYWGDYGKDYYEKAGVDRVFGFKLMASFMSFDKAKIDLIMDSTFSVVPAGKSVVVFLENHDMQRFASGPGKDPGKARVGAALNFLVGGIPAIYYGQELGMPGMKANFGMNDANDIPLREAFEWYKSDSGKGMAIWYKNSGPWWDSTNLKPNDGISVEEEKEEPGSLFNFYRDILQLRKSHVALSDGKYQSLNNNNSKVFSFTRTAPSEKLLIVLNLSGEEQKVTIDNANMKTSSLYPKGKNEKEFAAELTLSPYAVYVWKIND